MNRLIFTLLLLLTAAVQAPAQQAKVLRQHHFPKTVPAGNYSGITWLGGERYAVADDKSPATGFHLMTIRTDSLTGEILDVRSEGFMSASGQPNRDEEGICYVPHTGTVFVTGESDGQIREYTLDGQLTGRMLNIPAVFTDAYSNRSFEALTYNAATRRFWTTTENSLKTDGEKPTITTKTASMLRLQSFGDDLEPCGQYWYRTDSSAVKSRKGKNTLGVSGLAALDDGQIVVLEREVREKRKYIGSFGPACMPRWSQPIRYVRATEWLFCGSRSWNRVSISTLLTARSDGITRQKRAWRTCIASSSDSAGRLTRLRSSSTTAAA